jgi:hypothetical protein
VKTGKEDYVLQVKAYLDDSQQRDTQNFVGLVDRAEMGRDRFDFYQAPPVQNRLNMSIVDQDEKFAGNFKPKVESGQHWYFELTTDQENARVEIHLTENGQLSDEKELNVLDMDRRCLIPLRDNAFTVNTDKKTMHLKLIIGTPEYAENNSEGIPLVPMEFSLEQNYPNPFNQKTVIRYKVAERSQVRIDVYNLLGQRVRSLVDQTLDTGEYQIHWDGSNDFSEPCPSGVYLYQIQTPRFRSSQKMLLIR